MPETKCMRTRWLAFLVVALLAPLSCGCLAVVGVAAVGAGAAGYWALSHNLYRDYPKDMAQTTGAVRAALADLHFPPAKEEIKGRWSEPRNESCPDGARVTIDLRVIAGRVPAEQGHDPRRHPFRPHRR